MTCFRCVTPAKCAVHGCSPHTWPAESQKPPRYEVRSGSQTGHCCFEATVVDVTKPVMQGGMQAHHGGKPQWDPVCECFDMTEAVLICKALNATTLGDSK